MKTVDENLKNIEKDIEMKLAEKANTAQVMNENEKLKERVTKIESMIVQQRIRYRVFVARSSEEH